MTGDNGTYYGTYSSITLGPSETSVTFAPGADVYATFGDAIVTGEENAYTITNGGVIRSKTGAGIELNAGGTVTNMAGALIETNRDGVGVAYGSVINDGTIESKFYSGVVCYNSDFLNETDGVIEGARAGILVAGVSPATVTNYGTIGYANHPACPSVSIASMGCVVVADAESVFYGIVDGLATTLELGAGAGPGTLAGLGSGTLSGSLEGTFKGISAYVIGAGADWTSTGAAEIEFSTTLAVDAGATLVDTGTIQVGAYGTLIVDGKIVGDGSIQFSGASSIIDAASADALGVTIDGFSFGETIDLTGVAFQTGDSVSYAAGVLDLFSPSNTLIGTLDLDGIASGVRLVAVNDGRGGTAIVGAHSGTYTGTYSALFLTPAETDVTISATGVVNGGSEDPITGGLVSSYTVLNEGLIEGDRFIVLRDGGTVTDTTSGTIDCAGLDFEGAAGTIVNQGTIFGVSGGTFLEKGGLVENDAGALIQSAILFQSGEDTLVNSGRLAAISFASGATGTVTNSGTIDGSVGLTSGGSFSNSVGGVVTGGIQAGSIYNAGTIDYGVDLTDGGAITNTGTITAPGSTACGVVGFSGAVDNLRSGLIEAPNGIEIAAGPGTVINLGTIDGAAGFGVLVAGAPVTNGATNNTTALIEGAYCGVSLISSGEIVTNFGTIEGVSAGANGIFVEYRGTVTNYGAIEGGLFGVYLDDGGSVTNGAHSLIGKAGDLFGIGLGGAAGTVTNYGTIEGSDYAVRFNVTGSELVLKAGSVLIGGASGDDGTLKLAGGAGTITGLGETATISGDDSGTVGGFASYIIGGAGTWTLDGSNTIGAGASLTVSGTLIDIGTLTIYGTVSGTIAVDGGTVDLTTAVTGVGLDFTGAGQIDLAQNGSYSAMSLAGFRVGDTIDLSNVTYQAGDTVTYSDGHLYLESSAHLLLAELDVSLYPDSHHFDVVADGNGDTEIENVSCFYPGTLIRTPDGEVPVETLRPGDLVLTVAGDAAPIRWLGRQTVSTRFGDPLRILPIRIKAGAIAENLPARDLLCSADHAFLIDGVLIQAGALVNGQTMIREASVPERFTYWHVECDGHELILAEGLAAETFVDNADRLGFDNFDEHVAAYPGGKCVVEMEYPRAKAQRQIPLGIRQRLLRRARTSTAEAA